MADLVLSFKHAGYWETLREALQFADEASYESAVIMDADGQHDPDNVRSLLCSIDPTLDIAVLARSNYCSDNFISCAKGIGRRFYTFLLRILIRVDVYDPTSGNMRLSQRAIRMLSIVEDANILRDVCLLVWAADQGLTFGEFPGCMHPSGRKSKIYPTFFSGVEAFSKSLLCVAGQWLHRSRNWKT